MSHRYAIALGSNRRHGRHGAPVGVLAAAIAALGAQGLTIMARAPVLRTPALGPAGRSFANGAVLVETPLDPLTLLGLLKDIERDFGRRRGKRWGPRVLDLDILLWSGGTFAGRGLNIPHAEVARRDFALRPLAAIAPGWRLDAGTVRHALARLRRPIPVDRKRAQS